MSAGGHGPATLRAALEADPKIIQRLCLFARPKVPDAATAEDLASETVRAALDRERRGDRWDPQGKDAYAHLTSILKGIRSNWRRSAKRKPLERTSDPDVARGGTPDPEGAIEERDEALGRQAMVAEVRTRLERDGERGRIPLAMLEAADDGVKGHAAMAERIGCTLEEIRLAQRQLSYHAREVTKKAAEREGGRAA